jgi:hypothetical protein
MHGRGITVWNDGRIYEGDYLFGKKDGFGIYTYSDKKKYIGPWKNGVQHGIGISVSGKGK